MNLIVIYVSQKAAANLHHGITNGIWGFNAKSKPTFDIDIGARLLIGHGYSGGSPRADQTKWVQNGLTNVYVGEITSGLFESREIEFPNEAELDHEDRYIWRFRFNLTNTFHDCPLSIFQETVSEKLRNSAIAQSRANMVEGVDFTVLSETLRPYSDESATANIRKAQVVETMKIEQTESEWRDIVAIRTKPFLILAGLSGTGKSRLPRVLAYKFNTSSSDRMINRPPSNFELVKVRPNWHDSSDLLGYESRISGLDRFIVTDFVRFVARAWQDLGTPYFLCLDEMNLAPVEQYFAEYLSVIETRKLGENGKVATDSIISKSLVRKYAGGNGSVDPNIDFWRELGVEDVETQKQFMLEGISLPPNLIVIGTVNMDETTHSFSRKVLDRAMTIEMNVIDLDLGLDDASDAWSYPEKALPSDLLYTAATEGHQVYQRLGKTGKAIITYLKEINLLLEDTPFKIAYRVRDEFLLYAHNYRELVDDAGENWVQIVKDQMTLMKILPRIEGDERQTSVLDELIDLFEKENLSGSTKKAKEMQNRREKSHYTSFWK